MNVKDAIAKAKSYVRDVYADEQVTNLGLEEIQHEEYPSRWLITLGFSRPWHTPRLSAHALIRQATTLDVAPAPSRRIYKVVTIDDDGEVVAMRNRDVADTDG